MVARHALHQRVMSTMPVRWQPPTAGGSMRRTDERAGDHLRACYLLPEAQTHTSEVHHDLRLQPASE